MTVNKEDASDVFKGSPDLDMCHSARKRSEGPESRERMIYQVGFLFS